MKAEAILNDLYKIQDLNKVNGRVKNGSIENSLNILIEKLKHDAMLEKVATQTERKRINAIKKTLNYTKDTRPVLSYIYQDNNKYYFTDSIELFKLNTGYDFKKFADSKECKEGKTYPIDMCKRYFGDYREGSEQIEIKDYQYYKNLAKTIKKENGIKLIKWGNDEHDYLDIDKLIHVFEVLGEKTLTCRQKTINYYSGRKSFQLYFENSKDEEAMLLGFYHQ
ncbi:hypothetical protein [uncultured Thomasclavelia sp.]|uniref:hypothetical protein n=1 Tax=uncultured Thomasclavelia sp. TaxID=3025759 RepID=UPI0026299F3B|nr:hypothetical protein [uncultured Thomasclavelia sp.]